ncbi:MAG TPA: thiamine phosphate synthase [Candidatus Angelobacter sp.]|nr:thiamine phosphate synthase [Candidatus Angelobacter sp.]
MKLPRIYPILDFSSFAVKPEPLGETLRFAEELLAGGATIIQYRDKSGETARMLACARELRRITQGKATLIINDRADICLAAQADGVHLGQDDLSPTAARKILFEEGKKRSRPLIVGFSTHNLEQVAQADTMPIDYVAVGPVFSTSSKANPDPVIGLEGVRQARAATQKPLVAIGGITRKNCLQAREAGADAVAVIADLLESPVKALEEFIRVLG